MSLKGDLAVRYEAAVAEIIAKKADKTSLNRIGKTRSAVIADQSRSIMILKPAVEGEAEERRERFRGVEGRECWCGLESGGWKGRGSGGAGEEWSDDALPDASPAGFGVQLLRSIEKTA